MGERNILVTCEVQSLYTCIPHHVGIEALSHYLDTHRAGVLPSNEIFTLTEILSKNYFHYAGSYNCKGELHVWNQNSEDVRPGLNSQKIHAHAIGAATWTACCNIALKSRVTLVVSVIG